MPIQQMLLGTGSSSIDHYSLLFSDNDSYLQVPSSNDFDFGTGDFTVEAFCYRTGGFFTIFDHLISTGKFIIFSYNNGDMRVYSLPGGFRVSGVNPGDNTWFHLAVVRESGTLMFFIDGVKASNTHTYTTSIAGAGVQIGRSGSNEMSNGYVSSLRVVKGTAVYTSNFSVPTAPLTNITNTVLLCCQGPTTTTAAVIPTGSIEAQGSVAVSTENPFD